jgi:hypothetical protein
MEDVMRKVNINVTTNYGSEELQDIMSDLVLKKLCYKKIIDECLHEENM